MQQVKVTSFFVVSDNSSFKLTWAVFFSSSTDDPIWTLKEYLSGVDTSGALWKLSSVIKMFFMGIPILHSLTFWLVSNLNT